MKPKKRPESKTCSVCKKAPWRCRSCGRMTCEHLCRFKKKDGTATWIGSKVRVIPGSVADALKACGYTVSNIITASEAEAA